MSKRIARLVMAALIVSFVATAGLGAGAVTADCEPDAIEDCEKGFDDYEDMLLALFDIAHLTLQYAGFVTIFAGAVLWFTARRSSERAQTGVWLLIGGMAMIGFYFGFTAFVGVLRWIAEGGDDAA